MSDAPTLPLHDAPRIAIVKEHRGVATLPSLLLALSDLVREADDLGVKHVGLAGISPATGFTIALQRSEDGQLRVKFGRTA